MSDPLPTGGPLVPIGKAAQELGVHPNTLRNWAEKGLVAFVRLPSGIYRFRRAEIDRLKRDMFGAEQSGRRRAVAA